MHEHFVNGEWHPTDLFLLEELREGDIADTSTSLKFFLSPVGFCQYPVRFQHGKTFPSYLGQVLYSSR